MLSKQKMRSEVKTNPTNVFESNADITHPGYLARTQVLLVVTLTTNRCSLPTPNLAFALPRLKVLLCFLPAQPRKRRVPFREACAGNLESRGLGSKGFWGFICNDNCLNY